MDKRKIYEYLVTNDWFGSLEKGTRLYYDFNKGGYFYHTEYQNVSRNERYNSSEFNSTDYFMSVELADKYIERGDLLVGPELGELEIKTE